jgi:hypothetical protein
MDDLKDLFLFENTVSQIFDSEYRVAMAVLTKVRELKKEYNEKNEE